MSFLEDFDPYEELENERERHALAEQDAEWERKEAARRAKVAAKRKLATPGGTNTKELEKAYGNCHKCYYGKGYATVHEGYRSFDGMDYHESPKTTHIKYCTCERGTQLKTVVDEQTRLARIEELKNGLGSPSGMRMQYYQQRIKELEKL